jgi:phenylacetate-CoA ligase
MLYISDLSSFSCRTVRFVKTIKKNLKKYLRHKAGPEQISAVSRLIPRSVLLKTQRDNLIRQVRYCAEKSAYYREQFAEHGIDPLKVRGIEDLAAIETPNKAVVERPYDFVCCPPQIAFETTGTKGRNKKIFFTNGEVNRATSHIALSFTLYGLTPADRFVNSYNFSFWVPGVLHQKACEKFEAFCLPASKVAPAEIYDRLEFYKINVLMGYPSLLVRLTEMADANKRIPMKAVLCSSEPLPERLREYMQEVWGCKVYMGYGGTEYCGGAGGECIHQNGYHLNEMDQIVEIKDPDENGIGEILLTTLNRECMPLIRYNIGDLGRMTTERCKCGLPTARIMEIAGRRDEKATIGSMDFLPVKAFDELLGHVPQVTEDFQLKAYWEGRYQIMELFYESDAGDQDQVQNAIVASMKEYSPDIYKNYMLDMYKFRMTCVPPRSLRGDNVKLNRWVDIRRQQEKDM